MSTRRLVLNLLCIVISNAFVINNVNNTVNEALNIEDEENAANVFNGVYTECFLYLSYSCLQNKTLLYLKELNKLSEVSVIGEYVKFVKVNETESDDNDGFEAFSSKNAEDLSFLIDKAVDKFFNNHILKFNAMGKDIAMPNTVEEFVGRKRKGGGGGGGGGGHGGGGHEDGGKKKMMMMAMMCMKMKLMMMVPAMMGMMGMMSFKGMMFSMMSFMISKMMLLMKILEKKGGGFGGGGGGGGGDGGWAAGGGGGGGAWMPAGGQDGGGGGGYDANGQWQSRSIFDITPAFTEPFGEENKPIITYVKPTVRYNNNINGKKPYSITKKLNHEVIKISQENQPKSRRKRGIVDVLQNAYIYWINRMLGMNSKKYFPKYPKYKVVNGVKYVYYPVRQIQKIKSPKQLLSTTVAKPTEGDFKPMAAEDFKPMATEEFKPIAVEDFKPMVTAEDFNRVVTIEDFNKGEIVEGPVESRGLRKKLKDFNQKVNEAVDDNPWQ